MTHTQGPWTVTVTHGGMRDNAQVFAIVDLSQGANLIAGVFEDVAGGVNVAVENARLLAAAPDLLLACQTMLELIDGPAMPAPGMSHIAVDMLKNVIKAAGGSSLAGIAGEQQMCAVCSDSGMVVVRDAEDDAHEEPCQWCDVGAALMRADDATEVDWEDTVSP